MLPRCEFYNQWAPIFDAGSKYNWLDFTFFDLSIEDDRVFCLFKLDLSVLGLCTHFSWQYAQPDNEHYHSIKAALADIEKQIKDKQET